MKHLLTLLLSLALVACAASKGDKNNGALELPENEKTDASQAVCPAGQTLELADSRGVSIEELVPAIAVISGMESCARVHDIDDTFLTGIGQPKRISVDFSERLCVPNNSIWVLTQSSVRDDKVDYRYFNADGTQWIRLEGDRDIGATYARDHAGLRVLRCK